MPPEKKPQPTKRVIAVAGPIAGIHVPEGGSVSLTDRQSKYLGHRFKQRGSAPQDKPKDK